MTGPRYAAIRFTYVIFKVCGPSCLAFHRATNKGCVFYDQSL